MPRPRKCRRVCGMPTHPSFGPLGPPHHSHGHCHARDGETVVMSVDEFEAIRLIDHFGLTQEECAVRMDIARTTAQRIYDEARRKLAACLVHGHTLHIDGGDYVLYEEADFPLPDASSPCPGRSCCQRSGQGHNARRAGQ